MPRRRSLRLRLRRRRRRSRPSRCRSRCWWRWGRARGPTNRAHSPRRAGEARIEDVGDRGFRRGVDRFDRLAREEGFVARLRRLVSTDSGASGIQSSSTPIVERTRVGVGRCRRGHFLEPLPVRACRDVGGFPDIGVVDGLRRGLARRRVAPVVVRLNADSDASTVERGSLPRSASHGEMTDSPRISTLIGGASAAVRQIRARVLWHLDQDGFAVGLVEGERRRASSSLSASNAGHSTNGGAAGASSVTDERRLGVGHAGRRSRGRRSVPRGAARGRGAGRAPRTRRPARRGRGSPRPRVRESTRRRASGRLRTESTWSGHGAGVGSATGSGRGRRSRAGSPASPRLGRDRWGDDFLGASQLGDDVADRGGNRLRTVAREPARCRLRARLRARRRSVGTRSSATSTPHEPARTKRSLSGIGLFPFSYALSSRRVSPAPRGDLGKGQAFAASDLTKVLAELLR